MDPETRVKLIDLASSWVDRANPSSSGDRRLALMRGYYRHLAATVGLPVPDKSTVDAATDAAVTATLKSA